MKNSILSLLVFSLMIVAPISFASGNHAGSPVTSRMDNKHEKHSSHKKHTSTMASHHAQQQGPVGSPGKPSLAKRSVQVTLTDEMKIHFKRPLEEIKSGTVLQFIVKNEGKIPHEFSIGSVEEQKKHAQMMKDMPSMVHNDGNTITVGPGKTQVLTWNFAGKELVVFSCNIPGHYEAGMFKKVPLTI